MSSLFGQYVNAIYEGLEEVELDKMNSLISERYKIRNFALAGRQKGDKFTVYANSEEEYNIILKELDKDSYGDLELVKITGWKFELFKRKSDKLGFYSIVKINMYQQE